jgi:hypothetical protein
MLGCFNAVAMNEQAQIISTKEARRLLGSKADALSDAQVEDIITQLDFIATQAIKDYRRSQTKEESNGGVTDRESPN